jgi:hypothetical protein
MIRDSGMLINIPDSLIANKARLGSSISMRDCAQALAREIVLKH